MSDLDWYNAHGGFIITVLATLAVIAGVIGTAGHPVVAAGFYALAFAVASPVMADGLRGFIQWLF